ncbi:MAG: RNA polymerase factor sigma-54 [Alphaproteobacteria bacterium]|jgi:RNA polymerase sigma-54 factor|nr:RNA polymerase factor sigma-54 [Alphaproteobacteria bacterium]
MKQGPALQQQQKQDLAMTAELQQAIALLALSATEVQDFVAQEVADNPCLEFEDGADANPTPTTEHTAPEDWDSAWDTWAMTEDGANGPAAAAYATGGNGEPSEDGPDGWLASHSRATSLQEYLMQQFEEVTDDAKLRLAARFLIDGLDDAGYLRLDLTAVAAQLRLPEEVVDDARAIVQTLEPSGIGARDLAECLRLQLHARGQLDGTCEVCLSHLDLVATKNYTQLVKLAKAAGEDATEEEDIRLAITELQRCNPKPATTLGLTSSRIESVVPDVVVSRGPQGWEVQLNGAAFPKLLSVLPTAVAGNTAANGAKKYLNERLGRAKWLVGALETRAKNTLAVARAIVAAQPTFFEAGAEFLVPLTLRTVAETVGLHESTVSRVVSGKFMQTPFGVLPLRQFFASGVASAGGQVGVAASSVQNMIAKLVKAEDPKYPLSDEAIVAKLKAEGVVLARRTVAKYRGILNIPGTAERRVR